MILSEIVLNARTLLQDQDGFRWTDPEVVAWANEFLLEAVRLYPPCSTKIADIPLIRGPLQTIPDDGMAFIRAEYNMASPGGGAPALPVSSIRMGSKVAIDHENADWLISAESSRAKRYMYSEETPKYFMVWPPNDGNGIAKITYSAVPTKLTAMTSVFPLDDIYAPACTNYIVYRSLLKSKQDADAQQRAKLFYEFFQRSTTITGEAVQALTPNASQGY